MEGNGYADDLGLAFGGSDPVRIVNRIQSVVDEVVAWGHSCGLRFNPSKSEAVCFTRNRVVPPFDRIKVDGVPVEYRSTARYLSGLQTSLETSY